MKGNTKILVVIGVAVLLAEFVTSINVTSGMLLHSLLVVFLILLASFFRWESEVNSGIPSGSNPRPSDLSFLDSLLGSSDPRALSNFLLAVAVAPLIRIFSLAMPLLFFPPVGWYLITAIPMLVGVVFLSRRQGLGSEDLGLTLNRLPLQLIIGVTGLGFGVVEYFILRPELMTAGLGTAGFAGTLLVLMFATGFSEEITFRGLIQRNSVEATGKWVGILFTAVLFAGLHIGNSFIDAAFVLPVGLFFGYAAWRTGSILGVTLSHGLTNIVLFVVAPLLL